MKGVNRKSHVDCLSFAVMVGITESPERTETAIGGGGAYPFAAVGAMRPVRNRGGNNSRFISSHGPSCPAPLISFSIAVIHANDRIVSVGQSPCTV